MLPEYLPGWRTREMRQDDNVEDWVRNPQLIDIRPNLDEIKTRLLPEDTILDVGCYAGYLKDYFSGHKYQGIDLFPEHIDLAKRLHPFDDCFFTEDLFETNRGADVVICSRVLIHIPHFVRGVLKLIGSTKRMLVVLLKIGEDRVEWNGRFWQREVSPETLKFAFGECEILTFAKYSNVYKYVGR